MLPLKTQAITIALKGDWIEAARLNVEILKENPNDTEALNRLAFALAATNNIQEAKEAYERVLSLDPLNAIATRGLQKLSSGKIYIHTPVRLESDMFLEESGKTKIVTLLNTAPIKVIRGLQIGQPVALCKKRMKIFIQDEYKTYLGVLPDDLAKRLIKFLDGGNQYETYIKAANDHGVTIFIKETKRAARFKNQPSFLFGDKTHLSFKKKAYSEDDEEAGE